ncbi:MAG TPA: hypothetical protein VFB52_09180 [Solirubrobacterales bacterium]|nr:hypothetical protein [Solirubrobacterales bacterium]
MKLNKLFDKAKKTIDDRGGIDSLKGDAQELKKIATGKGSIKDKAKDAAAAIKEPGAAGNDKSEATGDGGSPQQP